jgi:hypothetical protein
VTGLYDIMCEIRRPTRSAGRARIGGDPIVVVLSEAVSDAHLAGLRGEGVSYFFAGRSELDLPLALDILDREVGVKRLLSEGGGGANGCLSGNGAAGASTGRTFGQGTTGNNTAINPSGKPGVSKLHVREYGSFHRHTLGNGADKKRVPHSGRTSRRITRTIHKRKAMICGYGSRKAIF